MALTHSKAAKEAMLAALDPTLTSGTITSNIASMGIGAIYGPATQAPEFGYGTPNTMLHHASVEKAENGFILKVTHKPGEIAKIYIAANTEELQRVFIAAIVAERVSK
jgi:hypothetical protein